MQKSIRRVVSRLRSLIVILGEQIMKKVKSLAEWRKTGMENFPRAAPRLAYELVAAKNGHGIKGVPPRAVEEIRADLIALEVDPDEVSQNVEKGMDKFTDQLKAMGVVFPTKKK